MAPLLSRVRAFEGVAGAPATDPRVLLALWLFATPDGVGSGPPEVTAVALLIVLATNLLLHGPASIGALNGAPAA